jgi:hypothetical protein
MINSDKPMRGFITLSNGSRIDVAKEYSLASFWDVFVEKLPFLFLLNF